MLLINDLFQRPYTDFKINGRGRIQPVVEGVKIYSRSELSASGQTENDVFTGRATRLLPARQQSSAPSISTASIISVGLLPWLSSPERWRRS